jgi:membrane associated rhomboid family serine protease
MRHFLRGRCAARYNARVIPLQDNIPARHLPVVTWLLILANSVVFAFELSLPPPTLEHVIYHLGLVPARFADPAWGARFGLTANSLWPFLTSMFLHGGWLHIIGNMWFLWIFGDNVEDRLGHVRFLIFYLVCGVAAAVTLAVITPNATAPTIGASGAIAGVLGAYFVFYPTAQVIVLIPILIFPLFLPVPAVLFIGFWFLMQFFTGALSLASSAPAAGGIAWWAHVGGFITGAILCRFFAVRRRPRRRIYPDEYGVVGPWVRGS